MLAIRWSDSLAFKEDPHGNLHLACNRSDLSTGLDNLVLRAAQLLREHSGCKRGAAIRLVKRIPMQAGLGGGSSDAAAALAGLNLLWDLGLEHTELERLGARLGSDVPFFFHSPAAWCTGRGDAVSPIQVGRPLHLVLVCPPFGCPTAAVYGMVIVPEEPRSAEELLKALARGDMEDLGRLLFNRLHEAADKVAPGLTDHARRLRQTQATGALLSGSGSTLFALARDRQEARRIARELAADPALAGCKVHAVRSCA
jgi:4-diphosphocytidyl-2-C-methyl-D-erythritol kinase